jgi:transposase-like protein
MAAPNNPFRRYPPAVRMVREATTESGERQGAVSRVAKQLGIGTESLRSWVKQADVDSGKRPGVRTAEQRRITELEARTGNCGARNEILKAAAGFFAAGARPATAQVVTFISAYRKRWGIEPVCKVPQVAPLTYYAALSRQPSARQLNDERLKPQTARVHRDNFDVYGIEKVWRQLNREGHVVGRDRVARLTDELNLSGVVRGKKNAPRTLRTSHYDRLTWSSASSSPRRRTSSGSPISPTSARGPGLCTWHSSSTCSAGSSLAGPSRTRCPPNSRSMHSRWPSGVVNART